MDQKSVAATLTIQRLMSKYSLYWDRQDLEGLVGLFAPDCVARYPARTCEGKEDVRAYATAYFAGEAGIEDSFHVLANPWIEPDGDTATGRWHFVGAYTLEGVGAAWVFGFYENEFERRDGEWRISTLEFEPKYVTPYDQGWVEQPFVGE